MSKCPSCGAELEFKPKIKKVHCDYCGSDFKVSELLKAAKKAKEIELALEEQRKNASRPKLEGKSYGCTQCGATLMSFDETAVTFCSYCGSQNMIEEKLIKQTAPDCIIPFSKTQEECINNYKKKIKHFIFSPNYMKSDLVIKKFRGIYMPYGIYNLGFHGTCTNHGEKYNHRSGDYIYYDDYALDALVDADYKGISFDLLSKFYDEYSHAIPFDYHGIEDFNENYLPGFYADSKDVTFGTYRKEALDIGSHDSTRFLKKKSMYSRYRCIRPHVNFIVEDEKVGFFPVYFAAIKDKDDKHLHYAVINGQTGKVAADMPIDFKKYIIFSILLAIPIFFMIMALPIILPYYICCFASCMSLLAWIICGVQLSKCNKRDNKYNDKGFKYILDQENKDMETGKVKRKRVPIKYKMEAKYWIKFLIGLVLPLLVVFLKPVSDMPYYFTSTISLILILLSFKDLINIHNIMVSRPIPQLEKRGGDEHE